MSKSQWKLTFPPLCYIFFHRVYWQCRYWVQQIIKVIGFVNRQHCVVIKVGRVNVRSWINMLLGFFLGWFLSHLSTAVAWREIFFKHFVFYKYFCLVLGLLKSIISEKTIEPLLNKPNFKLFHYKARVQPVSKITTVATRNRCWL